MKMRFVLVILLACSPAPWVMGKSVDLSRAEVQAEAKPATSDGKEIPAIAEKTKGLASLPGYFPLYWDARSGKLWLDIDKWNTEFLYIESLPAGIGSNDIGLDRGQLGDSAIVRFDRSGPRVLLVAPNYGYRATSNNPDERTAVRDAFAESTLWGFEVAV